MICTRSFARFDHVCKAVLALQEGTARPDQTIVVVDSNPELADQLKERLPADTIIILSQDRGASAARNAGTAAATGELVAFCDDDATPEKGWVQALREAFRDRPQAVGVGGRILPHYESSRRTLPGELLWVVGCTYVGHPPDPEPISRPIGANMAFRKAALLKIGGFSASFGPGSRGDSSDGRGRSQKLGYNEEIVLSLALRRLFGDDCLWYVPGAAVRHAVPDQRLTWKYLVSRSWIEGTSKADVTALFGKTAMSHDRRYVTGALLPAIAANLRRGISPSKRDGWRDALALLTAGLVTGLGYVTRRSVDIARTKRVAASTRP